MPDPRYTNNFIVRFIIRVRLFPYRDGLGNEDRRDGFFRRIDNLDKYMVLVRL